MANGAYRRAIAALGRALVAVNPRLTLNKSGAVKHFADNLVPGIDLKWFESELDKGDGRELEGKFTAAHSSSALAVNTFAPFKAAPSELLLAGRSEFKTFRFEAKCSAGIRGRRSPNLDLLAEGPAKIVGVESKLTEHLTMHVPKFSPAYEQQITDTRRESSWFDLMKVLMSEPGHYRHLDAAQLVKHAFGLAYCFPGQDVTLLYLYWEPRNADAYPELIQHREEVVRFCSEVTGARPSFAFMSYRDLWEVWGRRTAPAWLPDHLTALRARYDITI